MQFIFLQFGKGRELLLSSHDSRAASTKPHSRERLASSVSQPSTDQFMADEDGLTGVDELQSRKELDSYREKITLVCTLLSQVFAVLSTLAHPEGDSGATGCFSPLNGS